MVIEKKEDGFISIYEVEYDKKYLENLTRNIVGTCSIKRSGIYSISAKSQLEALQKVSNIKNEAGDFVYQGVKEFKEEFDGQWEHGMDHTYSFKAVKRCEPKLVTILRNITQDKPDSINELHDYSDSEELIPYEERLTKLDEKINDMSNYNPFKKMESLKEMRELLKEKVLNRRYDFDSLLFYYIDAKHSINYTLVEERRIIKKPKKD